MQQLPLELEATQAKPQVLLSQAVAKQLVALMALAIDTVRRKDRDNELAPRRQP